MIRISNTTCDTKTAALSISNIGDGKIMETQAGCTTIPLLIPCKGAEVEGSFEDLQLRFSPTPLMRNVLTENFSIT